MNDFVAEGIVEAEERDKALFSPQAVKYLYKVCPLLSRRCCSISNVCGLPLCLLYLGNNQTKNLLHVAFSFLKTSQKKKYIFIYIYEKEREHFALVVQLSEKKIRFVTLVSKCRRLVYLSSSNNVV